MSEKQSLEQALKIMLLVCCIGLEENVNLSAVLVV
jgi:hypothetical protein